MTEGVGAELVGGGREGRVSTGPQGSEGARAQRSPWRGGTTGRRGGSGNGVVQTARGAAFRKERGATPRGLGARTSASWVGDTAEASFASREAASRKGLCLERAQPRERPDRVADPDEKRTERQGASGQCETKTTVHAAWWSGPRLEGFRPEIVMRSRADAGGHRSAGEARERRSIRGTPTRSAVEGDNTSAPSVGSPKRALRRESASPRIVWEHDDAACAET
jgi:hypothetical protein